MVARDLVICCECLHPDFCAQYTPCRYLILYPPFNTLGFLVQTGCRRKVMTKYRILDGQEQFKGCVCCSTTHVRFVSVVSFSSGPRVVRLGRNINQSYVSHTTPNIKQTYTCQHSSQTNPSINERRGCCYSTKYLQGTQQN